MKFKKLIMSSKYMVIIMKIVYFFKINLIKNKKALVVNKKFHKNSQSINKSTILLMMEVYLNRKILHYKN